MLHGMPVEGNDEGSNLASVQEDGQGCETATHLQVLGDERGSKDGRKVARIIYLSFLKTSKSMIIKGFIKEVGQTREWTNKDGESRQSVKLTLAVPFVSKDGQEHSDELLGEMNVQTPEFMESLKKTCEAHEKCEMHVGFSLSDWQGKKIQNIRVFSLTKLMV